MKKIISTLIVFISLLISLNGQSDQTTQVKVITKDGNIITGELINETDLNITILSESLGTITLLRNDISSIDFGNTETINSEENEIDYYNSTRNLVSPTGFLLKKGQSYYENIGVFFNSYAVGITDNFNVAVGGELASLLFGEQFPILYVSPKFGLNFSDQGAWSIGTTVFTSPSNDFSGFGFVNTSFTFGNRNNNISLGTGLGFDFDGGVSESIVPIMIGGNFRLSQKLSLVSDNFIILYNDANDSTAVISLGLRIHFDNGAALNAALWRPTEDLSDILALPFISATIPLGRGAK